MKEELTKNINKIHTTEMGKERITKNLNLKNIDPVTYCINVLKNGNSIVELKGKNYYIKNENEIITINKYSYTIITAHKIKGETK